MHPERQRHTRRDRLPRRRVDRIEDVVLWMLITLGLLTAVLAASVAARRYDEGMHQAAIEARERSQVEAVLLEPAPQVLVVDDRGRGVRLVPTPVPVRYTAPDGTEHQATTLVTGRRPAGAVVPIWVDRHGALVGAPVSGIGALRSAAWGGGVVLAVGAVVLGGIGAGVRAAVRQLVMLGWEHEWTQVEPRWSGRGRSGAG